MTPLILPFILGITHCFETDHLLAVATMHDSRSATVKSLAYKGAAWGIGHSIPVFICGIVYVLYKLFLLEEVPFNLEIPVGILLILVGIYKLLNYGDTYKHTHHKHYLLVGIIHGMAGSAGIVLIHLTHQQDISFQTGYLLLFSFGAIIGMGGINVLISKVSNIFKHLKPLQFVTPIISIIYGIIMIYNYV